MGVLLLVPHCANLPGAWAEVMNSMWAVERWEAGPSEALTTRAWIFGIIRTTGDR